MKTAFFKRKGFVLFSVLCVILILIITIVPLSRWSISEFSWTTRAFLSLRALNLADVGAEAAIWQIVHNEALFTGWSGASPKTITLQPFTDNAGQDVGDVSVSALSTSPDHYIITSTGFIPDMTNPKLSKTVKVMVYPHALFNNGIFGNNSVTLTGNADVDSYDSDDGPYSAATAGDSADVGTNGTFELLGQSTISGDVFVGPGGSITTEPSTTLSGETYYSGGEVELDPVFLPASLAALSSGSDLAVHAHDTEFIHPGDHRYDSIIVDAQGTLEIDTDARLYVQNDFTVAGNGKIVTFGNVEIYLGGTGTFAGQGIINDTGIPDDLMIYGLDADASLTFSGGNDFYGGIYAPESTVYITGGAEYYGAVMANDVTLDGIVGFHFDEDLLNSGPSVGYDIAYWQEN